MALPNTSAQLHLANAALYRLGEKPIVSFDEGTQKANAIQEIYPDCRDTLLSWQSWPFATVRQQLARLDIIPPSDFAFYYRVPTEPFCLRVIDIDLQQRMIAYQREVAISPEGHDGTMRQIPAIATDAQTVVMRYVARTGEHIWSPLFTSTLIVYLAQAIAPAVSGKASLKQSLLIELYGQGSEPGMMQKLRDTAGYEDSPRAVPMPDTYIAVRGNLGATADARYWW
jgi:hypothetical protein